ncbi:MAG: acyl-CoA dehydrogenase family protein [Xanthobacteraceae bacterium]
MYSLHLSAEQIEFRDTVRSFVDDEIKPVVLNANRLDIGDRALPKDVLDKASQMGLRTLALAEELGGVGADALTCCIVTEELAAGDAGIATVLAETSALGLALFGAMTNAQRDAFLPAFLEDDRYHLAYASHEPDTDTALGIDYHRTTGTAHRVRTKAERNGDSFVVSGVKDAVVNAGVAKLFAVEVDTGKGIGVLLIPAGTRGLTVNENAEPRWYHGSCGEIILQNCTVPADSLLQGSANLRGEPGRGAPLAQAINLGIGRAAYEAALDYARLRVQGGRPIVEHQAIGGKLAEVAVRLEMSRNAVWQAAWASDHPAAQADRSLPNLPLTAMAQVFASEAIYRAVKDAAECFGAMGVMRDMPLQKYISDARICLYSGDGNSDLKLRIAEQLSGHRRAPLLAAE